MNIVRYRVRYKSGEVIHVAAHGICPRSEARIFEFDEWDEAKLSLYAFMWVPFDAVASIERLQTLTGKASKLYCDGGEIGHGEQSIPNQVGEIFNGRRTSE